MTDEPEGVGTGEPLGGMVGGMVGGVLVGGESRRFGSSKERVTVGGVPMVVRALRALEPHAGPLFLLGTPPDEAPCRPDEALSRPDEAPSRSDEAPPRPDEAPRRPAVSDRLVEAAGRLPDLRVHGGPLAGVEALLAEAVSRGVRGALTLPTDLPLLGPAVVGLLVRAAARDPGRVVVLSGPDPGELHPLCGYWPSRVLPALRSLLDAGERTAHRAASALDARVLGPEEVIPVGDPRRLFLNVNTPADRSRAEALLAAGKGHASDG